MRNPCKECEERFAGCGAKCEVYKAFRIYNLAEAAEHRKKQIIIDYQRRQKTKSKRK